MGADTSIISERRRWRSVYKTAVRDIQRATEAQGMALLIEPKLREHVFLLYPSRTKLDDPKSVRLVYIHLCRSSPSWWSFNASPEKLADILILLEDSTRGFLRYDQRVWK